MWAPAPASSRSQRRRCGRMRAVWPSTPTPRRSPARARIWRATTSWVGSRPATARSATSRVGSRSCWPTSPQRSCSKSWFRWPRGWRRAAWPCCRACCGTLRTPWRRASRRRGCASCACSTAVNGARRSSSGPVSGMARLYVPAERLDASELEVAGPEHHYLCRVLRLRPGDPVVLFDGQGHERDAQLIRVGPRAARLRLSGRREVALPSGPALTLLVGLAKGDKMDFIVQKATELGVARIVPVLTERSVIRPSERTRVAARQARWNKIAREAARQCGRADVPAIAP